MIFLLIFDARSWSHLNSESGKFVSAASLRVCVRMNERVLPFLVVLVQSAPMCSEIPDSSLLCEVVGCALVYLDAIRCATLYIGRLRALVVTYV